MNPHTSLDVYTRYDWGIGNLHGSKSTPLTANCGTKKNNNTTMSWGEKKRSTLPETNSKFALENGWLEYDRFLLGPGPISGALAVSFSEGMCFGVCRFIT